MAISLLIDAPYLSPFVEYLNHTDYEKYIVEEIKALSKVKWFRNQNGSFGKSYNAPFAETLTSKGVAFTFNLLNSDDLINTQE